MKTLALLVASSLARGPAPEADAPPEEAPPPSAEPSPPDDAPPDDASAPLAEDSEDEEAPPAEAPEVAKPLARPDVIDESGTRVVFSGGDPDELELFRLDPNATDDAVGTFDGIPYTRLCADPCEARVRLQPNDQLFVAGPRLMPSKTFTVNSSTNELTLHVRPGPKRIRFAGFGLTVSGAILIPGGGLIVGAIDRGRGPDIAGFTLIGVGVVALAAGIALLVRGRTLVRVNAR